MADPDQIFPLPLSDFEHYAFRDDSPEHPMVIVLRTPFEGPLNLEVFQSALSETIQENPLLRAIVDESGWRLKWSLLQDHEPVLKVVHCEGEHPPINCPPARIDLTQQAGVVFELRLCANRGVLVSYFHHAVADGLGGIRFLGDLFACYGARTATSDDDRPTVRKPDPSVLPRRGSTRKPGDRRERSAPIIHTLIEAGRLFLRKSYRMLRHSPQPPPEESVHNIIHTQVLPRMIVKQLKKLAATKGVSTNDLCMVAFLQHLVELSADDPSADSRDLFRILMPVSMRTPDHDEISAANVVSYVFHSYRRHEIRNSEALLAAIHHKSQQMIHRNEGAAMLHGFAVARWIPGLFRLSQKLQPDFATAVMTNVGEVRRVFENRFPLKQGRAVAGNVVIQSIDGVAPVRENTNLAVAFGTYGGELIMHLNCNTNLFSHAEADEMISSLADRIVAMVQETPSKPGASAMVREHTPMILAQDSPVEMSAHQGRF